MITLTRRQAHDLRAIFRRSVLGITHRGTISPLVLRTLNGELRLEHVYNGLGVACNLPGGYHAGETIPLPLDALADVEGRDQSPVAIEAAVPERTVVRWEDRGVPQLREYTVFGPELLATLPEPPTDWSSCPGELLDALAEACQTCDDNDKRYALGCIQLRGGAGEIVATDGRQVLVQRGYHFPWEGDLLVRHTPLFGCKDLPRDRPLSLAKTGNHIVLRIPNWTVYLELQTEARYPKLEHVLPTEGSEASCLRLDPADATYLAQVIERLPGADENNAPITLDLNGRVAVRGRDSEHAQTTELVLARSGYTGTPIRISSNRELLARAVRLGFNEVLIADVESPVWCRDGRRVYAWQPLDKDSVIEPTDDAIRIESSPKTPGTAAIPERQPKARNNVSERTNPARNGTNHPGPAVELHAVQSGTEIKANGTTNGVSAHETIAPTGLIALIREAEALHESLADAKSRTARFITALRRQKKRDRLVASTLTALKELKLQEVNE